MTHQILLVLGGGTPDMRMHCSLSRGHEWPTLIWLVMPRAGKWATSVRDACTVGCFSADASRLAGPGWLQPGSPGHCSMLQGWVAVLRAGPRTTGLVDCGS